MASNVESESQKFDAVMRKILSVSKEELKKREKAWRRKRERAKKKAGRVPHSFAFFANEWVSANKRDARAHPLTKRLDRTGLLPFFITNARATHHRLLAAHRRQWRSTCGRAELCPSIKTALGAAPAPLVGAL